MDRQANKKLRLSSGSTKPFFNDPYRSSVSTKYSSNTDDELWGDDLAVDDNLIQEIESQGYSQYQCNNNVRKTNHDNTAATIEPSRINDSLQLELQTKTGEVKNLRLEIENKAKEFRAQINEKDAIIEDLKKQLSGKQSEIEFQKIELLSQSSKTPKSSVTKSPSIFRLPQNPNNSFHERFEFNSNKNTVKDSKVINFSRPLHKGDVLFKIFQSALSCKEKNVDRSSVIAKTLQNNDDEFSINLETHLLELCRYSSFHQSDAQNLLRVIFLKSKDLLLRFHEKLSHKEIKTEITNRKSKIITLPKTKDASSFNSEQCLLMNTKWSDFEKGIHIRQTITMLAKLVQVESAVADIIIEPDRTPVSSCPCSNAEKLINMNNLFNSSLRLSSPNSAGPSTSRRDEKMDVDEPYEGNSPKKKKFVFDVVELAHDIIQEITVREKSVKYEGVFSSILYLYSTLCNCDVNLYEKQIELMINSVKKMLFSLPGFVVVQYIIEFLSSSSQFSFFNALCCKSAAETFSENFRSFSFAKETCLLQVICAYVEMVRKTPQFIFNFVLWVCSLTSTSHKVKWLSNKTDSKFCECLLMLEQITVRIMLSCVDLHNSTKAQSKKNRTKSVLKRCVCIFQQFRWQDTDFDLHISTCRGEYRMLLQYLRDIAGDDDVTIKFVSQELELTNVSQKHDLSSDTKSDVIESMLKVFSEDNL